MPVTYDPIQEIYIGSDYVVILDGLWDQINEVVVNDATVTINLYESDGVTGVSGGGGINAAYVAGSSGKYRGKIQDTVTATLTSGSTYVLEVVAVSTDKLTIRHNVKAKYKT